MIEIAVVHMSASQAKQNTEIWNTLVTRVQLVTAPYLSGEWDGAGGGEEAGENSLQW